MGQLRLVYGAPGMNVDEGVFNKRVHRMLVGKLKDLNIREGRFVDGLGREYVLIGPLDMEVHSFLRDGRMCMVLDVGRLFPAENGEAADVVVMDRLFRKELLKLEGVELPSDDNTEAFWASKAELRHKVETKWSKMVAEALQRHDAWTSCEYVAMALHSFGVPMRCLPNVLQYIDDPAWSLVLRTEMSVREFRNEANDFIFEDLLRFYPRDRIDTIAHFNYLLSSKLGELMEEAPDSANNIQMMAARFLEAKFGCTFDESKQRIVEMHPRIRYTIHALLNKLKHQGRNEALIRQGLELDPTNPTFLERFEELLDDEGRVAELQFVRDVLVAQSKLICDV